MKNTEEDQEIWKSYEENNQKKKIYFQLWQYREFPSVNSILAFTKIPIEEGFLLDLLAIENFRDFYKFIAIKINKNETRELLRDFHIKKFIKNVNDLESILSSVEHDFSQNEINHIYRDFS